MSESDDFTFTDEQINNAVEIIDELKSEVYLLACDYSCYDYRIILFYNMDSYTILERVIDDANNTELSETFDDFIDYYSITDDDVKLIKDLFGRLSTCLGIEFALLK